jgi:PHD/YefM family antitoxin component YafN of YafNO toxin-antitoxin module
MVVEVSYRYARANLSRLFDRVVDDAEALVVRRPNSKPVAIVDADELARLRTEVYLLASPRNRRRLLAALRQLRAGEAQRLRTDGLKRS